MNKYMLISVALGGLLMLTECAIADAKPIVLKGNDPIQLIAGKEVKGSEQYSSEFGKFKYLFANAEDKKSFDAAPEKFAVQRDGKCVMMPEMTGDPNLYLVSSGKIYLAGTTGCMEGAKGHVEELITQQDSRKKVAIMIFPGVQIIDYTGPYEVLGEAGYEVFTVAATAEPLTTNMGMVVTPNYTFANCPKADILICPGGNVPQEAKADDAQVAFVKKMSPSTTYTMSVCNGAFWLANAGLLDGKKATTFYGMLDDLKTKYPKVQVINDRKFADNGNIICTAGLSSGIEGALHLVEKIEGSGAAKSVALNMEYNWQPNSGYARGALADQYLRKAIGRGGFTLPDGTDVTVLDVSGDRNTWDKSWQLSGKSLTQQALMQGVQKQLAATWTLINAESDGVEKTTWKFKGDDGSDWSAETIIKPDATTKGAFVMSVHLEKKV
jgi:putative intracellular protease/amidase/YHS domain-containing protein